jgi:hypothetical protein
MNQQEGGQKRNLSRRGNPRRRGLHRVGGKDQNRHVEGQHQQRQDNTATAQAHGERYPDATDEAQDRGSQGQGDQQNTQGVPRQRQ